MIIFIECIVLCFIFTLFAISLVKNPIKTLYNYPPKIQEKVKSMKEYKDKIPLNEEKVIYKFLVAFIILIVVSLIMRYINGYTTFKETFFTSLFIWTIVNMYDAFIIDIVWFCHSKKVRFKGTEEMVKEYQDYWFHIKESLKGELIGLLICVLVALIVQFIL